MSNKDNLNAKEALGMIQRRFPGAKIIACTEFPKFFVFGLVGQNAKPDYNGHYFSNGVKIDRSNGAISQFFPPFDGIENFRNGKKINLE